MKFRLVENKNLMEDNSMPKFHMVFTVDGVKSEQDISAVNVQKAEELIRKQYNGQTLSFMSKQEIKDINEANTIAKPFRKEIKDRYKAFDKQRDYVRKYNKEMEDRYIKPEHSEEEKDLAKEIFFKKEPKFNKSFRKGKYAGKLETKKFPYYITYYGEDAYYHPEEGGYFVVGMSALSSKGFENKEDALREAEKWAEDEGMKKLSNTHYVLEDRQGEQEHLYVETEKDYLGQEEGDRQYESLHEDVEDPVAVKEDAVEESERVPQTENEVGLSNLIIQEINGEWETIQHYNDLIAIMRAQGYEDMIDVISDIVAEENTHIGQLQKCLQVISPNVSKIEAGETEAMEQLYTGEECLTCTDDTELCVDGECDFVPDDDFGADSGFDIYLV